MLDSDAPTEAQSPEDMSENRTKMVAIRLTEAEHEQLETVIRITRRSASDLFRRLLREEHHRLVTQMDASEMLDRASRHYYRKVQREHGTLNGVSYPNSSLSGYSARNPKIFELRNINGILGRYRYDEVNDRVFEVDETEVQREEEDDDQPKATRRRTARKRRSTTETKK